MQYEMIRYLIGGIGTTLVRSLYIRHSAIWSGHENAGGEHPLDHRRDLIRIYRE